LGERHTVNLGGDGTAADPGKTDLNQA